MLGSIRKFSGSIYAKILLGIIIIPFVFWGMGSSLTGGNKNIVVVIDKEKYSIQEFSEFINFTANEKVESKQIDEFLTAFISEKLIEKEIEKLGIKLSDDSLSKLIKHQKDFKRNGEFSRTEYEKFLLKNNITAINFESILSAQEKKKQLFDFISGGIIPSKFLINKAYDSVNQKRDIELINLNDAFKAQLDFSDDEVQNYFEKNKKKYAEVFKSINFIELSPKNLIDADEFTDLFFKKIDEIDNFIITGKDLDFITSNYNLKKPDSYSIDKHGFNLDQKINKNISKELVKKIFNITESEPTVLIEDNNKYFLINLIETKIVQKKIENSSVKNDILLNLGNETKRKLIIEIIDKINKKNFNKQNFNEFAKDKNVNIQKISLKNINDNQILKKELVSQIYRFSEKRVIVVNDLSFLENYLIFIDNVQNVNISSSSDDYQKYVNLSRNSIVSKIYNTYDKYIRERYKVDINYQALDVVKNYFN
tara:strand:+ start:70 stop:1512 length:1443 start_codon:yes stop_codon:yes gene_type:complete